MAALFQAVFLGPLISMTGSKKMGNVVPAGTIQKDLAFLVELLEAGKVVPVIDRRYPLGEVPEAVRYYGEGHSQGKVVITVEHNSKT
jgi:NADPH:quinone reductase-like Zn-dependent oxidoreductase